MSHADEFYLEVHHGFKGFKVEGVVVVGWDDLMLYAFALLEEVPRYKV